MLQSYVATVMYCFSHVLLQSCVAIVMYCFSHVRFARVMCWYGHVLLQSCVATVMWCYSLVLLQSCVATVSMQYVMLLVKLSAIHSDVQHLFVSLVVITDIQLTVSLLRYITNWSIIKLLIHPFQCQQWLKVCFFSCRFWTVSVAAVVTSSFCCGLSSPLWRSSSLGAPWRPSCWWRLQTTGVTSPADRMKSTSNNGSIWPFPGKHHINKVKMIKVFWFIYCWF